MRTAISLREAGMLAALLIMLAAPICPAHGQATAPAENLVDQLGGLETAPEREKAPSPDVLGALPARCINCRKDGPDMVTVPAL